MFCKKLLKFTPMIYKVNNSPSLILTNRVRSVHISSVNYEEKKEKDQKAVSHKDAFQQIENKTKNTYLEMVKIFVNRDNVYRRGHVEFIYAALKNMEEFGVQKDLEVYKAIIDVLPKGKFVPTNIIQAEFMHYPKQQQCIIDLLQQMEDYGVMPDFEMEDLLLNIFGRRGYPLRRYWRMMYWLPKFKNLSPWAVPDPLPTDTFELAKYAIERISSADVSSVVTVYYSADIKDSIDDTWIVSAQSKNQRTLLAEYDPAEPVFVEGSFKVWIKGYPINHFILRGKAKPVVEVDIDIDDVSNIKVPKFNLKPPTSKKLKIIPSVHEQEDGIIFSLCATGTSSKDSLLSWIRHLELAGNPNLSKVPVVFKLRSGVKELAKVEDIEPNSAQEKKELDEK